MTAPLPFDVPRTPVGKSSSSFRSEALTFPEPNVARVNSTGASWGVGFAFFLAGLGVLLFATWPLFFPEPPHPVSTSDGVQRVFDGVEAFFRAARLVIPGIVGLVFVVLGAALVVSTARSGMTFDVYSGMLRMKRRRGMLGREIRLRDVAALQLLAVKGENAIEMNLVLSRPKRERVNVMCHGNEQAIRSDAQKLAEFLNVPVLDQTHETLAVEGHNVAVDVNMIPGASANFRTMKLIAGPRGALVLKSTGGGRLFRGAFMGMGSLFAVIGLAVGISGLVSGEWFALLFMAVFTGGGSVFALIRYAVLRTPAIVFDRSAGTVSGASLKIDGTRVGSIPLKDVAAVQICSGNVGGEESYRAFQLNLVLARPEGARVPLMAHAKEHDLRDDARTLAEYLRVPLLDHAGED